MPHREPRRHVQRVVRRCSICGADYEVIMKFFRVDFAVLCPACTPMDVAAQARAAATRAVNRALDREVCKYQNPRRANHPLWGRLFR